MYPLSNGQTGQPAARTQGPACRWPLPADRLCSWGFRAEKTAQDSSVFLMSLTQQRSHSPLSGFWAKLRKKRDICSQSGRIWNLFLGSSLVPSEHLVSPTGTLSVTGKNCLTPKNPKSLLWKVASWGHRGGKKNPFCHFMFWSRISSHRSIQLWCCNTATLEDAVKGLSLWNRQDVWWWGGNAFRADSRKYDKTSSMSFLKSLLIFEPVPDVKAFLWSPTKS